MLVNLKLKLELFIKFSNVVTNIAFQGIHRSINNYGMPEFMQQASRETRQEMWKIMKDRDMTRKEKEAKIDQLIKSEPKPVQVKLKVPKFSIIDSMSVNRSFLIGCN